MPGGNSVKNSPESPVMPPSQLDFSHSSGMLKYLHFECGTFFYQNPLVMDVKRDSLTTMEKGREIALSDTRQGFFGSLFCAVLRVFSPLL